MKWVRCDPDDEENTTPQSLDKMVWVIEEDYVEGVTIGSYDGQSWSTVETGGDDCFVSYWAPITYPPAPEGWIKGESSGN